MREISYQMALYLFAGNQTEIYMLYEEDGTESLAQSKADIDFQHETGGIFGVEEWLKWKK